MIFKKTTNSPQKNPDEPVAVIVEHLPGCTDDEVVTVLKGEDADDVKIVSPGFISARLAISRFARVEAVGVVHRKSRKQPR